ncbi:MAG: DUF3768 domain-containing protein [Methylacidiphilales bacterium]|nr:DUF3768 domain-containing protein [Candidatus Methylacidiphilales bacterium]
MSSTDISPVDAAKRIRDLNDEFRRTFVGGVITLTEGVDALGPEVKAEVLRLVREFDRFTEENDPHGEHDFGSLDIGGQVFFWKCDYYDKTVTYGSKDPADPEITTRVLTIMKAEEY